VGVLCLAFCLGGEASAASILIDDFGFDTTVVTVSPWSVASDTLYCSGSPSDTTASASDTTIPLDLTGQTQFVFDLAASSGCGGTLTFQPYDGDWDQAAQTVALTTGTATVAFASWGVEFTPSSFAGYSFNFSGSTGGGEFFYIDNLQASPEVSTILLYALGLMLCGVYLRIRH
jgi:hypothetical protein